MKTITPEQEKDPLKTLIFEKSRWGKFKKFFTGKINQITMQKIYINQYQVSDRIWLCTFDDLAPQSAERKIDAVKNRKLTIKKLKDDGNPWNGRNDARTISVKIPQK